MTRPIARLFRRRPKLVNRDATAAIQRIGDGPIRGDLYYWLMTTPGLNFALVLIGAYLGLNALFALAYLACGDGIANARHGSFEDAFFFSVQTMATIGYGTMGPVGFIPNALVTIEAGVGLFGVAVAAGLMYARFTRPTAGVRFSDKVVITTFDGVPTLMLRLANRRNDRIHEARVHLTLLRDEQTSEGVEITRMHDLALSRSSTPMFTLTWTVMHPITPQSPLYGKTMQDLMATDSRIIIVFAGHHSGFNQDVHERAAYDASSVVWNARFADLFREVADGQWAIDFSRFDDVIQAAPRPDAIPGDENPADALDGRIVVSEANDTGRASDPGEETE